MKKETRAHEIESRRFERRLPHPPEKVWRALTDDRELACWFPEELKGEREILEHDPPRRLAYSIGDETLRWELSPIPGGCLLVLTSEVRVLEAEGREIGAPTRDRIEARLAA